MGMTWEYDEISGGWLCKDEDGRYMPGVWDYLPKDEPDPDTGKVLSMWDCPFTLWEDINEFMALPDQPVDPATGEVLV